MLDEPIPSASAAGSQDLRSRLPSTFGSDLFVQPLDFALILNPLMVQTAVKFSDVCRSVLALPNARSVVRLNVIDILGVVGRRREHLPDPSVEALPAGLSLGTSLLGG
jgi:hypothetical protein